MTTAFSHRRRSVIGLVVLLVSVLGAGAALGRAAVAQSAATPAALGVHVVEHLTNVEALDLGKPGESMGDQLVFSNPVYDEADATQVGTSQGSCVRTVPGAAWECMWTVSLADGQLTSEGPFFDASESAAAITGGTGAYADAAGQVELRSHDAAGTAVDFIYRLR